MITEYCSREFSTARRVCRAATSGGIPPETTAPMGPEGLDGAGIRAAAVPAASASENRSSDQAPERQRKDRFSRSLMDAGVPVEVTYCGSLGALNK